MSGPYFDRLQAGLRALVATVLPSATVAWAPTTLPETQVDSPLVTLQRRGGGWAPGEQHDVLPPRLLPTQAVLTVTGNAANTRRVTIDATGATWQVEVAGGTSDSDFRDAIQAALGALGHSLRATFTPIGATQLQLDGDFLGALGSKNPMRVVGDATVSTITEQLARIAQGSEQSFVQVEAKAPFMSGQTTDPLAAHALLGELRAALHEHSKLLGTYGLALRDVTTTVDLTRFAGPGWQSRAAFDLTISQNANRATAIAAAQSVATSFTDNTITIDSEVAAP